MQTEQNEFKIGDFVKLKEWENFLEVTGLDESYPTARIRITEGDYGSWYDVSLGFIKQGDEMQENNEVTSLKQDEFQVGDTVWCVAYGKGKVTTIDDDVYCIGVESSGSGVIYYTKDGRLSTGGNRSLFFSEPKVEAAVTRPFVPTLVEKKVVVQQRGCRDVIATINWETSDQFGNDEFAFHKNLADSVYEVQSENLLKK